jgi:hypothetical protein
MRPTFTAVLSLCLATPTFGSAQAPATGPVRESAFESLRPSQWVRLLLSPAPEPVRVPAASIDTLWTRGYSTRTGGIVGALLGLGAGALLAASVGEADVDRNALWAVSLGGGTVAGGLVGMLIGTAVPRWNRKFP